MTASLNNDFAVLLGVDLVELDTGEIGLLAGSLVLFRLERQPPAATPRRGPASTVINYR